MDSLLLVETETEWLEGVDVGLAGTITIDKVIISRDSANLWSYISESLPFHPSDSKR